MALRELWVLATSKVCCAGLFIYGYCFYYYIFRSDM